MASQDNRASRKRRGDYLESLRSKVIKELKPKTDGGRKLVKKLQETDALDTVMQRIKEEEFMSTVCKSILPKSKDWNDEDKEEANSILRDLRPFGRDKDDIWKELLGDDVKMNGHDAVLKHYRESDFQQDAAQWSRHPDLIRAQVGPEMGQTKVPSYTAFSGASGSGKTSTMLWALHNVVAGSIPKGQKCLKYYISCAPRTKQGLFDYVSGHIEKTLSTLLCGEVYTLNDFPSQFQKTWLVLLLDEVQSRFQHTDYLHLRTELMTSKLKFQKVVLLVGSTALSLDVCKQPTSEGEVLNIRMKPIQEEDTMKNLLKHHLHHLSGIKKDKLGEVVEEIFRQMPVLWDLMSNQRCAFLSAVVLSELIGKKIPMEEIPPGWGQGHSSALVAMVACKYRGLNGLASKTQPECRRLMLDSLALLAGQKVVGLNNGVDKVPEEGSLAFLAQEVVEIGLVERAVLPDEKLSNTDKVKIDGNYEFQMSPALTLICASVILPSIDGIFDPADHFEALVAILMVAMRYAQTSKVFHIQQLSRGVPYSGSEDHKFYAPQRPIDQRCFINGPQAPYSDLIVAGVPKGQIFPNTASALAKAIKDQQGVEEFPAVPLLVQCKQTYARNATCTFQNEYAKMGFIAKESEDLPDHVTLSSPKENPYPEASKQHKQYPPGRWLTKAWVKKDDDKEQVAIAFATNRSFAHRDLLVDNVSLMEADGDYEYAWQVLYPISQLVREEGKDHSFIGRRRHDEPTL